MPRKSAKIELQEVSLTTRFRKFTGDRRSKVRDRAKVEVVQVGEHTFGVTVKRGTTTVKKGTVSGAGLTEASVRASVRKDIKGGGYDAALFDGYDRLVAAKKAKKK